MTGHAAQPKSAEIQYLDVLASHWRWLAWAVLLALAAATVLLVLQPPMYRTEARVFVRTPGDVSRVIDGGDSYAQARARTYSALASSPSVSARVVVDLQLAIAPEDLAARVEANNPPGTALIDIAVSAPNGPEAQRTAKVLLAEQAATVRALEAVPGSMVPRAELVTIDPPGRPERVAAWGVPVSLMLVGATLIGLVIGATAAVLHSLFTHPARHAGGPPHLDGSDVQVLSADQQVVR